MPRTCCPGSSRPIPTRAPATSHASDSTSWGAETTMRRSLRLSVIVPLLLAARASAAQPGAAPEDDGNITPGTGTSTRSRAGSVGSQRSQALDAAFGTPPANAPNDPGTTADPDYASRKG